MAGVRDSARILCRVGIVVMLGGLLALAVLVFLTLTAGDDHDMESTAIGVAVDAAWVFLSGGVLYGIGRALR